MWKKAFVLLLSLDLLVFVIIGVWFATLPKPKSGNVPQAPSSERLARIQLSMGQDAINTYLAVAVSQQPDLKKVLSYATVQFGTRWKLQFGLRAQNRVVPADLVIAPKISGGNLDLQIEHATLGHVPIPLSLLMLTLRHASWPNWIAIDTANHMLNLNFSERPKSPYGVEVLGYSPQTQQLSMRLLIAPKAALSGRA